MSWSLVAVNNYSWIRVWRIVLQSPMVEVWMIVGHGRGLGQYGEDPLSLLHVGHYIDHYYRWYLGQWSTVSLRDTAQQELLYFYVLLLATLQIKVIHCL